MQQEEFEVLLKKIWKHSAQSVSSLLLANPLFPLVCDISFWRITRKATSKWSVLGAIILTNVSLTIVG